MSTVAVIVIAVLAVLALAMLVAGGRKATRVRARQPGPGEEYRSHAEASRRGDF